MTRLSPELVERLRGYQHAPDEPPAPESALPRGVKYNRRLERYEVKAPSLGRVVYVARLADAVYIRDNGVSELELLRMQL